ncbi:MAG: O-antigen ligase family protein [Candidatus Kerfeldbacteria bacterium]|nr:O-antigen ligase family protein [Candidatus Kerfeldbacteria bacterium]
MLPAFTDSFAQRSTRWWFVVMLAAYLCLDLLAFTGWVYPWLGTLTALLVMFGWLLLAKRDLALGVTLLVVELVVGSQGYLLSFKAGGLVLSLRLLLFLAAFTILVWRLVIGPKLILLTHPLRWWYLAVLSALGWGSAVAFLRGNGFANIFLDLNGYLYLGLFPLFFEAAFKPSFVLWLRRLCIPALVWLGVKTIIALYLFSHFSPEGLLVFYQWWRQTGFGEITYVSGNWFRIFSQSHVWAALASVVGLVYLWRQQLGQAVFRSQILFSWPGLWFSLVILLASFSRSFWLGVGVVWLIIPIVCWRYINVRRLARYYLTSMVLGLAAAGFLIFVTKLNWPQPSIGATSAAVFSQRLGAGEAAGESRLRLLGPLWRQVSQHLVLGNGFGTTVTYKTSDPRIVRSTAGGSGLVTTYAFEWGYLDSWLKFGLLGLVLYLGFVVRGLWPALLKLKLGFNKIGWADVALMASAALLVVNLTTPYLNHPLGLGALMLAVILVASESATLERAL